MFLAMSTLYFGRVYFASRDAQRKRHYREGQSVNLGTIECFDKREIGEGFWQVDLDSTGTSYLHVAVERA